MLRHGKARESPGIALARKSETGRHHADNGARFSIDIDRLSNYVGIGSILPAPQGIAQNRKRRSRFVTLGIESTANMRGRLHHSKEIGSDPSSVDPLWLAFSGDVEGRFAVCRETLKASRLAPESQEIWR